MKLSRNVAGEGKKIQKRSPAVQHAEQPH